MSTRNPQAPSAVIMIRPHHFRPNPETVADNAFQQKSATLLPLDVTAIEMAGGSVRCMLAGIHLSSR